ncbi:PREDICTED: uncharacterized protein LOC106335166 isoform X2 [Brassica oleracea var. oleracea]|uniref:uncharacterized protein LOC106335166 isoform X2 n=1 Tax=Brassica oleracea var. oleracea TaxID=109376 RepID=UPI0006A737BB|nr:PREDICTED: uncharacterized protein LOC106335166 isoform X2 [Brassica oleracea var. oleracea]
MSTVSKTKSRDKKIVNDSQKAPSQASGSIGATTGGAYNPLLGTFQTVETLNGSSSLHNNGRFRSIDDSDSTTADFDSVSNNGSWSGDSEDHKEKALPTTATAKQEAIPGAADNDNKREKMRLKNERKHQRQKEKRAQELHERCCQFLMSRKLEVLVQQVQVIVMGISHERATYALMLNEGKLEESVNWLLDDSGASVADTKLDPASGNLKLDISQELGRILELEREYKCAKQDVEKAVVTAEGDIEKAEESLTRQKEEQSTASVKAEDVSDNASVSRVPSVQESQNRVAAQLQPNSGMYTAGGEEDRKSLGYLRGSSYVNGESGNERVDRIHTELQWLKMQQNAAMEEKKRMLTQQTQLPRPREETHYVSAQGGQFKRLQQREPVMAMQQQQQRTQLPVSTMNSSFTVSGGSDWYSANRSDEAAQSNGYLPTRTLPPSDLNSNLMYQQLQYRQYQGQGNNGHRTAGGSASSQHAVAPAASLGLFSGYGSTSSSGVDWNTDGSAGYSDYNNIDWSLDRGLACPTSPYEANMNGRTRTMGMAMGVQEAALVGNGREWTSPFEGKDLFSLSRQYVPPSL